MSRGLGKLENKILEILPGMFHQYTVSLPSGVTNIHLVFVANLVRELYGDKPTHSQKISVFSAVGRLRKKNKIGLMGVNVLSTSQKIRRWLAVWRPDPWGKSSSRDAYPFPAWLK